MQSIFCMRRHSERFKNREQFMHITQESDYAVRMVYCLAKSDTRRDARSISEEMCVTLRFSLKILGKLVTSGIVKSYKGNCGGYELARPPAEVSLKDVIDAVEGPYQLARCSGSDGSCNRGASGACAFQRVFGAISDSVNQQLQAINFQTLVEEQAPLNAYIQTPEK